MPAPLVVSLRPAQMTELAHLRDHDPTPYMREKAAAILKVAGGQSLRAVAATGVLRPRRRETIAAWVRRYLAEGPTGLRVRPGRGRKPAFPPLTPAAATATLRELIHHSPRLCGLARRRWRLDDLRRVVPGMQRLETASIWRILRRLDVRYQRGRLSLPSPDPAYDAKLAAVTAAQLLAHAHPEAIVLLYQDEVTYHRRPSVSRAFAPMRTDAPRAEAGLGTTKLRRIAACLDAATGRVLVWQRHRFDRGTLRRFSEAVVAAYPDAEVVFLAQANWPVHFHPELLAALPRRSPCCRCRRTPPGPTRSRICGASSTATCSITTISAMIGRGCKTPSPPGWPSGTMTRPPCCIWSACVRSNMAIAIMGLKWGYQAQFSPVHGAFVG